MGDPQNGCFISGKILQKWMITRGTTIYGNHQMDCIHFMEDATKMDEARG